MFDFLNVRADKALALADEQHQRALHKRRTIMQRDLYIHGTYLDTEVEKLLISIGIVPTAPNSAESLISFIKSSPEYSRRKRQEQDRIIKQKQDELNKLKEARYQQ